ncbi:MAG TPA: DUF2934 domain-containing protein [Gemmatimonadaceae bacterium]|nr:DUF2934 domain-containing protein [Gemmatimonadaceae bacterium]
MSYAFAPRVVRDDPPDRTMSSSSCQEVEVTQPRKRNTAGSSSAQTRATRKQAASMQQREEEVPIVAQPRVDDEIRVRAYEIYLERGAGHGRDLEDWLQAERECQQRAFGQESADRGISPSASL